MKWVNNINSIIKSVVRRPQPYLNSGNKVNSIPKILVDTCIMSTGYADPARWKTVDVNLGQIKFGKKLLVYEIKRTTSNQRHAIKAIKAISNYANQKLVHLYIYPEILWECYRGLQSMRNNLTPLAAFNTTNFSEIPSPIERGKLFQTANWERGEYVEEFIDFLLGVDKGLLRSKMSDMPVFSEFEKRNASKLEVFRNMCSDNVFGRKRGRDAYHFWAAECSNLDYFLTTDKKLLNTYNNAIDQNKLATKCKIIAPEALAKKLNISIKDIELPEAGKMFLMSGREYTG